MISSISQQIHHNNKSPSPILAYDILRCFFLSGRAEMFVFGILTVPNRTIFVVGTGRHDSSHDSGDVEIRPGEHLL